MYAISWHDGVSLWRLWMKFRDESRYENTEDQMAEHGENMSKWKRIEVIIMITVISGLTLRQRSDSGLAILVWKWGWSTWKWCSSCCCRVRGLNRHLRWRLIACAFAADLRYSAAFPLHTFPLRTGNEETWCVSYKTGRKDVCQYVIR